MSKCMVDGCEKEARDLPMPIKLCVEHAGVRLRHSWSAECAGDMIITVDDLHADLSLKQSTGGRDEPTNAAAD